SAAARQPPAETGRPPPAVRVADACLNQKPASNQPEARISVEAGGIRFYNAPSANQRFFDPSKATAPRRHKFLN
ncbi:MAG: hypothetical protein KF834_07860, partial [Burkholderiales bacterium]|nr:hypothetical protein [Burkholderiales bacterium]